mmetsp:Transcript_110357/g.216363  ORF Transcript_110357/g.216363 Transcript_110357/m.216363 type:complete len:209 (-) Transcript_110357:173-799(-)
MQRVGVPEQPHAPPAVGRVHGDGVMGLVPQVLRVGEILAEVLRLAIIADEPLVCNGVRPDGEVRARPIEAVMGVLRARLRLVLDTGKRDTFELCGGLAEHAARICQFAVGEVVTLHLVDARILAHADGSALRVHDADRLAPYGADVDRVCLPPAADSRRAHGNVEASHRAAAEEDELVRERHHRRTQDPGPRQRGIPTRLRVGRVGHV